MIYVFYHRESEEFVVTTNYRVLEKLSGMPYHQIRSGLQNGSDRISTEEFIMVERDIVKGKQRVKPKKEEPEQSSERPDPEPGDSGDIFDNLLKSDV